MLVVPPRTEHDQAYVIFSGKEATQGPAGLHSKRISLKSAFIRCHPNLVQRYDGSMKTVVSEESVAEQKVIHSMHFHKNFFFSFPLSLSSFLENYIKPMSLL